MCFEFWRGKGEPDVLIIIFGVVIGEDISSGCVLRKGLLDFGEEADGAWSFFCVVIGFYFDCGGCGCVYGVIIRYVCFFFRFRAVADLLCGIVWMCLLELFDYLYSISFTCSVLCCVH